MSETGLFPNHPQKPGWMLCWERPVHPSFHLHNKSPSQAGHTLCHSFIHSHQGSHCPPEARHGDGQWRLSQVDPQPPCLHVCTCEFSKPELAGLGTPQEIISSHGRSIFPSIDLLNFKMCHRYHFGFRETPRSHGSPTMNGHACQMKQREPPGFISIFPFQTRQVRNY